MEIDDAFAKELNKHFLVYDFKDVRTQLPVLRLPNVTAGMLWSTFKNLLGKDLSKFSLPVFINEPLSTLQKAAEMVFFANHFLKKANAENDSLRRMIYVAGYNAATYYLVKGRTGKPFNPLLGETFELLSPNFRYFSEAVSHHPPIAAICAEGDGWQLTKTV